REQAFVRAQQTNDNQYYMAAYEAEQKLKAAETKLADVEQRVAELSGSGQRMLREEVTDEDIAKVKKRPAVEAAEAQAAAGEEARAGEAAPPAGLEEAPPVEGQAAAAAAVPAKPAEAAPPEDEAAKTAAELQKRQKELADKAQEKIEMVELLNLKLNALYQEFQGLDNIKSREMIQLQISDAYDKLLKAEAESAQAQKELEGFLAEAAKKKAPPIWIR
ncbi:MAG TPA: hypothetical protein PLP83_06305, partial [Candidatus Aminicenantes bacterium]|nr:hypothetical protein [Candidatus Aminicenantes bacterium]